jgi:hypothetical protein
VGPRAGLENVEKRKFLILPGLELRLLRRAARSQSLYRLALSPLLIIKKIPLAYKFDKRNRIGSKIRQ